MKETLTQVNPGSAEISSRPMDGEEERVVFLRLPEYMHRGVHAASALSGMSIQKFGVAALWNAVPEEVKKLSAA